MNNFDDVRTQLSNMATQCKAYTVISKDLLNDAAAVITDLQNRIVTLEAAAGHGQIEELHGDLIDRDSLAAELMLDTSIEVMARTKIINEYITYALMHAPVIVPANNCQAEKEA